MKEAVLIYQSFVEASKNMAPEEYKEFWENLFNYALYGQEPEEIASPMAEAMYIMAKPQIDANTKRYENGNKGGAPKGNSNAKKEEKQPEEDEKTTPKQPKNNLKQPSCFFENNLKQPKTTRLIFENNQKQPNDNEKEKENENVNDKDNPPPPIGEELEEGRPRDLRAVVDFCKSEKLQVEPTSFFDYYAKKNWETTKGPVKDWKALIQAWNRNPKARAKPTFTQREYDFDELEREILAN